MANSYSVGRQAYAGAGDVYGSSGEGSVVNHRARRRPPAILLAPFLAALMGSVSGGYEITNRWTSTITNGGGIAQGDPITLLWSIVPDGEDYSRASNSNLIDYLDDGWSVAAENRSADLTNRPWWSVMNDVYQQYSRVSGITMLYEPEQTPSGTATGQIGDLRIGGENIDATTGGVLADNAFPNNGDMRIDTSRDSSGNASFWHSNAIQLRNLVAHESGHGVGLNHTDISGADAVMESPLETDFWGLQFDDIYALNQNYGDPYEKGGGNDALATGTDLGFYNSAGAMSLGTDAGDSVVEQFDGDWLGIDGNDDLDWFKFTVGKSAFVDIRVTPMGPSYTTVEQGSLDAQQQADLNFQLFASDGATLRHSAAAEPAGGIESLDSHYLSEVGDYYILVDGDSNLNQFYQLDLHVSPTDPGDFDGDGNVNGADFVAWQKGGSPVPQSGLDLADWQTNYGTTAIPALAAASELTEVVPEPRSLLLGTLASLIGITGRQRLKIDS